MKKISVFLADNQFLIRVGLKSMLSVQPNVEVVGECCNEQELLHKLEKQQPDVIILDHNQPDSFNQSTLVKVKEKSPATNILIISGDNHQQNIYNVLENGATGFLTKKCHDQEIINAIRATAKGERFYCNSVMEHIMQHSFSKKKEQKRAQLTEREIQVVKLISEGKIAKEIAAELNLSTHTVYTHRKNIMKKLQLGTASEVVLYAVENGLI